MSRGIVSPGLYGRADLAAYAVGLREALNVFGHATGGASNRPGFEMGALTRLANRAVRYIPFVYNEAQAYLLEVGHEYMRVISRNAHVLEPAVNVTGATNANPGVITAVAHGLIVDDWVTFLGVGGMTRLNGRTFLVNSTPTANTLTLKDFNGVAVNTTNTAVWSAYTSGGTIARVATFTTPWAEADLPFLNFDQNGDVLRVVCAGYDEVEIARGNDHHLWTVTDPVVYGPRIAAPTAVSTAQNYGIRVIEVEIAKTAGGEEIRLRVLPKRPPTRDGDKIRITGLTTVTELNGREYLQSRSDPDGTNSDMWIVNTNGSLIDATGFAAAAGTHAETGNISTEPVAKYRVTAVKDNEESLASQEAIRRNVTNPQETAPVLVKFTPPTSDAAGTPLAGVQRHYLYKEKNGVYGFIAQRNVETRTPVAITGITQASMGVITTGAAHGRSVGDYIYVYGVAGMTQVNGTTWKVGTVPSGTQIGLHMLNDVALDTTAFGAYTSGGSVQESDYYFEDDDIAPELEDPAPPTTVTNPFSGTNNTPRAIATHEQRTVLAGTTNDPLRVNLSQSGNFYNWNESEPRRPDDAMEFTLASARGSAVLHALSLRDLFFFTKDGVWVSESGESGYAFENIRNREISKHGAAEYPGPIPVDRSVLYVHRSRRRVMDLAWDLAGAGYDGNDQALMAEHLFEGTRIADWCYQDSPERLVWQVLDDGSLLSLTYLPKHEVFAWCRHATDGEVETIGCIPEDNDDSVYIAVNRGVAWAGGRRYIERLHTREFTDALDAFFVDSGLTWDNPVAMTAATAASPCVVTAAGHGLVNGDHCDFSDVEGMQELNGLLARVGHVSGNDVWMMDRQHVNGADKNISGITQANPAVVTTATAHGRTTGDRVYISGVNGMTQVNGKFYRAVVTSTTTFQLQTLASVAVDSSAWGAYTSDGRMDVARSLDASAFTAYTGGGFVRKAIAEVNGLDHLIGKTVSILANGNVVAPQVVDALGRVTLTLAAGRVHVGLPYTSEIETLDALDAGGELAGRARQVTGVVLRLWKTRGVKTGIDRADMKELFNRQLEGYDEATGLIEGEVDITPPLKSNLTGRVIVQQTDPLPMTVLGVVTEFEVAR